MRDRGETDLEKLLAAMEPTLDEREYAFASVPADAPAPAVADLFALIQEAEATTLIAPAAALAAVGLDAEAGWARISLTVHSALDAVGLTASFSGALAVVGISANVVAGRRHDHIFVPWTRRFDALAALRDLSAGR